MSISPPKHIEVNNTVCKVKSKYVQIAAGANAAIVPAVSGKIIRVMGFTVVSAGAAFGVCLITDGSGGTVLFDSETPIAINGPLILPITETGYFETTVSVALWGATATTAQSFNVFYIEYTP